MMEWLRRLLGDKEPERRSWAGDAVPDPEASAFSSEEFRDPDDDEDEDEMACAVCSRAILRDGYCSHIICAYQPLGYPLGDPPLPGTNPLVHFLHNNLPSAEIERLCAAVSAFAAQNPKSGSWENLNPLMEHMVSEVWERETKEGDGTFAVSCDTFDDYLYNRLHESVSETFMGAASAEAFVDGPLASIVFRAYCAEDVPRISAHLKKLMRNDAESLEGQLRD